MPAPDGLLDFDLQRGIVHLTGEIHEMNTREVAQQIEYAEAMYQVKSFTLTINSNGGSVHDALGLYDFLTGFQDNRPPRTVEVKGLVRGQAASSAAMIVLQATKPRVATSNSFFLLHEPGWEFGRERLSGMRDTVKELDRLHTVVAEIMAKRSGKSPDAVREDLLYREVWLSAAEAKEWGLIDTVRK